MKTKAKTVDGVPVRTRDDYACDVRCPGYHSGNRGLVWLRGEWWECQGCGGHFGHRTVAAWQARALLARTHYETKGDVRGWCGHRHRTLQGAVSCLCSDRVGCRAQGGYSDRAVVRVTGTGPGEYEYVDLDIRSAREWAEVQP